MADGHKAKNLANQLLNSTQVIEASNSWWPWIPFIGATTPDASALSAAKSDLLAHADEVAVLLKDLQQEKDKTQEQQQALSDLSRVSLAIQVARISPLKNQAEPHQDGQ